MEGRITATSLNEKGRPFVPEDLLARRLCLPRAFYGVPRTRAIPRQRAEGLSQRRHCYPVYPLQMDTVAKNFAGVLQLQLGSCSCSCSFALGLQVFCRSYDVHMVWCAF